MQTTTNSASASRIKSGWRSSCPGVSEMSPPRTPSRGAHLPRNMSRDNRNRKGAWMKSPPRKNIHSLSNNSFMDSTFGKTDMITCTGNIHDGGMGVCAQGLNH